jgi:hypothetical protein
MLSSLAVDPRPLPHIRVNNLELLAPEECQAILGGFRHAVEGCTPLEIATRLSELVTQYPNPEDLECDPRSPDGFIGHHNDLWTAVVTGMIPRAMRGVIRHAINRGRFDPAWAEWVCGQL